MWSPTYRTEVLEPDYAYAGRHLKPYFLDALVAHLRTVALLHDDHDERHRDAFRALERALGEFRHEPTPPYSPDREDFFFTIQAHLEARLERGTVSLLRIGLSRNDLDMTVYRMHLRDRLVTLMGRLCDLRRGILALARDHANTVIVAYTHHQPAQPTSLAHYVTAIESSLHRDYERLRGALARLNESPMGAAALAGSSHPLDRHHTARLLGFDRPVENTYDAVSASDWQIEAMGVLQTAALTLSRFLYDLLNWASQGLITLPDGLVQGSSIMPQKRNPVALEHARARFSKATGHALAVLFSSHNIPYGDLNDPGPDVQAALSLVLDEFTSGLELLRASVEGCVVDAGGWRARTDASDTTATELADVLTQRYGVPFQDAHRAVGALVRTLKERRRPLLDATPDDLTQAGGPSVDAADLREALDAAAFIRRRSSFGGPNPELVKAHIASAAHRLDADCQATSALASQIQQARVALGAQKENV